MYRGCFVLSQNSAFGVCLLLVPPPNGSVRPTGRAGRNPVHISSLYLVHIRLYQNDSRALWGSHVSVGFLDIDGSMTPGRSRRTRVIRKESDAIPR